MNSVVNSRRRLVYGTVVVIIVAAAVTSVFVAQQRALAAEEEYVTAHLEDESCLSDRGVNEGAANREVSIEGVTIGGVRVAVSMPYAYTTGEDGEQIFADAASDAVYVVTLTDTHRISGDEVSIC